MFTPLEKLFQTFNLHIANVEKDLECEEYCGYNFQLGTANIKFRKAKITPKKIGQFVTLWRRNSHGITEPFHIDDDFDFYMVYVEKEKQQGLFLFPKSALSEKQILTKGNKEGKRGFRIYPTWDIPKNKQAQKTKAWQKEFFIDLNDDSELEKLKLKLQV